MRSLILHDRLDANATSDAADALVQARLFETHLRAQGHEVSTEPATLDLAALTPVIEAADLVVNLVESLEGRGSLIHLVPALVESLGVRMTGCPAEAIATTSNKLAAKRAMRAHSIPTPAWTEAGLPAPGSGAWIVKSVWEHASIGIGPDSIVDAGTCDLADRLGASHDALGGLAFAESYIEGREFNLSVLEAEGSPVVLPPAEIRFVGYAEGRPRIVDYAAKWDEGSYEYHHTPRTFDLPESDEPLLIELRELALRCWRVFGLRGYARVDFRVDAAGQPFVLEVNSNPCLSPDAGFMAAAERSGRSPRKVIDLLLSAAHRATGGVGRATVS